MIVISYQITQVAWYDMKICFSFNDIIVHHQYNLVQLGEFSSNRRNLSNSSIKCMLGDPLGSLRTDAHQRISPPPSTYSRWMGLVMHAASNPTRKQMQSKSSTPFQSKKHYSLNFWYFTKQDPNCSYFNTPTNIKMLVIPNDANLALTNNKCV